MQVILGNADGSGWPVHVGLWDRRKRIRRLPTLGCPLENPLGRGGASFFFRSVGRLSWSSACYGPWASSGRLTSENRSQANVSQTTKQLF